MDIMEMLQVVLLGISIVFVVLISIILLCKIMSAIIRSFNSKTTTTQTTAIAPKAPAVTSDKSQLVAVIGSAIASHMGTDVSNIKIHSIKKI